MKIGETDLYQVRVLDDGTVKGRRHDRRPMTDQDWNAVEKWVESSPGVTVADLLGIFGGGRILSSQETEQGPSSADWAAIQAERDHWKLDGDIWRQVATPAKRARVKAA